MQGLIKDYKYYLKEEKKVSESTLNSYISDISVYIDYLESKLKIKYIEDVTKEHILKYLSSNNQKNVATSTLSRNISSIKSFHKYLLSDRYVDEDVSSSIKKPKIDISEKNYLTLDQVEILLNSLNEDTPLNHRNKAMIELMYATGLKVTELIELTTSNIDLPEEIIIIKKKDKERIIPIPDNTVITLRNYIINSRTQIITEESPYLFTNNKGEKMTRQGFNKMLSKQGENIGLENINPSMIRDSFSFHLLENGLDIVFLQELLGHENLSTTQIYSNIEKSRLKKVVNKFK